MIPDPTDNRTDRCERGFTLLELLVALGVLLLLTLGINEVFRSVTRVVSVGSGIAETNAAARVIERQLRDDFLAFNRIPADQNFMVIRSRKLGDINGNGTLDTNTTPGNGERALYLTDADRRHDLESGIDAYANNSRAVTVRLDEIAFLGAAPNGEYYESYQQFGMDSQGKREADHPVLADSALITYGHGLRPYPDLDFDATLDPTHANAGTVMVRHNVPDGDFGQRGGDDNIFALTGRPSEGGGVDEDYPRVSSRARNEFAGDFFVLRQAALLYGGEALGLRDGNNDVFAGPVLDSRQVIPFVRDWEIAPRMNLAVPGSSGLYQSTGGRRVRLDHPTDMPIRAQQGGQLVPQPRLRRMGRSDIIAMTRADVQRWLEGIEGPPIDSFYYSFNDERIALQQVPRPDASPWSSGPFEVTNANNTDEVRNDPVISQVGGRMFGEPDDALWPRQGWVTGRQDLNGNSLVDDYEVRPYGDTRTANAPATIRTIDRRSPLLVWNNPNGGDERGRRAQIANTRGVTSAIAGVMTRMLAETEPPRMNRRDREAGDGTLIGEGTALMDLHAVLATRCSSLEIAWSNGWIWKGTEDNGLGENAAFTLNGIEYPAGSARLELPAIDSDGDTREVAFRPGERIWFDYEMSQVEFVAVGYDKYGEDFLKHYPLPDLIAEVPRGSRVFDFFNDTANNYGRDITTFLPNHSYDISGPDGRLLRQLGVFTDNEGGNLFSRNLMLRNVVAVNDRLETGVYDWRLSMGAKNPAHEYMAVFPFRRPLADAQGSYGGAWEKPGLVRFRFTLHDEQFRVQGGRVYEFVMGID